VSAWRTQGTVTFMTNVRVINVYGAELELQSLLTSALDGSSELHSPVALLLVKLHRPRFEPW